MTSFLSDLFTGSFGGTTFMEQFSSGYAVEPDSGVEYTTTKIPGGNKFIVQTAGAGPRTLDLPIACALTQLNLLRSKADAHTRASLVYHAGTVSATLLKVKSVRKQMVDDAYLATLELIIG